MEIDKSIIERIQQGDALAYEHVYQAFYSKLYNFAYDFIYEDAHEIVQNSLLKLWENRASIHEIQNLQAYLYKSVRNSCLNFIRRQSTFKKYQTEAAINLKELEMSFFANEIDEKLERSLHDALDKIPEKRKKVFFMHFIEGYKAKEISEELNISERTVHTHVYKAMKSLKDYFKDYNLSIVMALLINIYLKF